MAISNGLGTYGDGAGVVRPIDHRLAQLGLIAKTGAGTNAIRPGLFYDGVSNIVTGAANMSYNVAPFTAVSTRGPGQGAVLFANDGVVNVATTAAPGTNSRIDVVYAWQREFALDGGSTAPVIGVVQGAPGSSPAAPSLAAFPGAIELARITVPAGVTATNSGATITQTAPFTALDGGPIPVRNFAGLPATAVVGSRARTIDTGVTYEWSGSAWVIPPLGLREVVRFTSSGTFSKASYPWLRAIRVRCVGGGGAGGGAQATSGTQASAGGGGGSGAYSESFITDIAGLAASVTVTVGAGGTGVSGADGGNGGQSSFGALVSAGGGFGGLARGATTADAKIRGGIRGAAGVGDIAVAGNPGGPADGAASGFGFGGAGGASVLGAGGVAADINEAGGSGGTPGGGGGGACNLQSQVARAGGNGGAGIVIVELFA